MWEANLPEPNGGAWQQVRHFQIYSAILLVFSVAASLALIVSGTDGGVFFTLDDPYIHLALAESILHGHYGINAGEYASPSSSIVYPFLLTLPLAFLLGSGFSSLAPLFLTVPASLLALWLISGCVWTSLQGALRRPPAWLFWALGPALMLAVNAVALPLTGMEHSLHVLACALTMCGLLNLGGKYPPATSRLPSLAMTIAGILLCAGIRFEGLALAFPAIACLFVIGFRRSAVATLVAVLALLAAHALLMTHLGLPVLPSSVLAKSFVARQATETGLVAGLAGIHANLVNSMSQRWGIIFALAMAALLWALLRIKDGLDLAHRLVGAIAILALMAHLLAGRYDWFGRYEVYAVAITILGLAAIPWRPPQNSPPGRVAIVVLASLLVIAMPYMRRTAWTPAAAANIYQQQYQMHRFSKDYFPYAVAVNDLGWVAFNNDAYVLDLWGLGSEHARRQRQNGGWNTQDMTETARQRGIAYAMIYDSWFEHVPESWCPMATLITSQVSTASDRVTFYAIDRRLDEALQFALETFAPSLPAGASLTIHGCEKHAQGK